jgi:hypothetical protein
MLKVKGKEKEWLILIVYGEDVAFYVQSHFVNALYFELS